MAGEAKTHEPTQLLHVLVPTDGSEASLRAVAHIAGLAECGVAIHVHLLNVQPPLPQSVTEFVPAGTVADYHNDEADKALAKAEALLKEHGLAYERHVEVGHAGAKIAVVTAKDKLRLLLGKGLSFGDGSAVSFSSEKADQCTMDGHGIEDVCEMVGMGVPEVY